MGSNMRMGVIKEQDFGVKSKVFKLLLVVWEGEWVQYMVKKNCRRHVVCLEDTVVIRFGGGLRVEYFFPTFLEGVLKFW